METSNYLQLKPSRQVDGSRRRRVKSDKYGLSRASVCFGNAVCCVLGPLLVIAVIFD